MDSRRRLPSCHLRHPSNSQPQCCSALKDQLNPHSRQMLVQELPLLLRQSKGLKLLLDKELLLVCHRLETDSAVYCSAAVQMACQHTIPRNLRHTLRLLGLQLKCPSWTNIWLCLQKAKCTHSCCVCRTILLRYFPDIPDQGCGVTQVARDTQARMLHQYVLDIVQSRNKSDSLCGGSATVPIFTLTQ